MKQQPQNPEVRMGEIWKWYYGSNVKLKTCLRQLVLLVDPLVTFDIAIVLCHCLICDFVEELFDNFTADLCDLFVL